MNRGEKLIETPTQARILLYDHADNVHALAGMVEEFHDLGHALAAALDQRDREARRADRVELMLIDAHNCLDGACDEIDEVYLDFAHVSKRADEAERKLIAAHNRADELAAQVDYERHMRQNVSSLPPGRGNGWGGGGFERAG